MRQISSCAEALAVNASNTTGVYGLNVGGQQIDAFCDMSTDGGGWTLILNYLHLGGTTPDLRQRSNSLPLQAGTNLGVDEAGTASWGHALPELVNRFQFEEIRFFCRSANPAAGRVHFSTNEPNCLDYARTGNGSCFRVRDNFRALPGHNSPRLPAAVSKNNSFNNEGPLALTRQLFAGRSASGEGFRWNVGKTQPINDRIDWECDDNIDPGDFDTFHQVWIR